MRWWLGPLCTRPILFSWIFIVLVHWYNSTRVDMSPHSNTLSDFFDSIFFYPYLCAFRRGHGCQTTKLILLEDWWEALDKNYCIAAVLMDLSKAFDCLPHDIALDKLSFYGVSSHSVSLLKSYLTNRKQQTKISSITFL
jgi:hypothetical protein